MYDLVKTFGEVEELNYLYIGNAEVLHPEFIEEGMKESL